MPSIEVPLNRFVYRFRPLPWHEEVRIKFAATDDQRKVLLAQALVDISGLRVSPADAMRILNELPEALFWRIWVVYRGNLPMDRFFASGPLYEAPDTQTYRSQLTSDTDAADEASGAAMSALSEQDETSSRIFAQAKKSGTLTLAQEENHG